MPVLSVAIAVAIGIVLLLRKARYNFERLPKIPYVSGAQLPEVSIIVPARNEEARIARVLGSFPEDMVVVVDDHSEDRTAEIAREMDVRVISAPPLGEGKLGKPNACMAGAEATEGEWLLFVDADTKYARVFLPSLMRYAMEQDLEMVSVFLKQEAETLAERMLLPYAFALYFTGVNTGSVNGRPPREWLANGQCLLVSRKAYKRMGGHAAVDSSVIEDVALAKLAAEKGIKTRVTRAEHMGSVRMYDSFGAIVRGFEKNSFRFLQQNPMTAVQVVLASVLLTSWLPVLALLLLNGYNRHAMLFALVPSVILFPWYRSAAALLAPAAIYVFQFIALNSMVKTLLGKKSVWKGREV
ncbi:MAG: glycosyltransferase [Bryobacterales bacterium]|nr:glycosyltransferase [Bryobacterales bacterium]